MNTFFDKIYIINLKQCTDRKEMMTEQMIKLNIDNYVFEEALFGKDINIEYLKSNNLYAYPGNTFCKKTCSCQGEGHGLNNNEIALHLTHYNIWNDIVQNNYTKCLILEDDCIFTEDITNVSNIINNIPINWKILFLGHTQYINSNNSKDIDNPYFLQLLNGVAETHIYAVTQECARILIEHTYPIRAAVDGYLGHFMINKKILTDNYICKNKLGINGSLLGIYKSFI
jgi:GR25 family glycosyltransferase involved in LPS biosynthesis